LGALNRGYWVTVVADAVITGRDKAQVLKRYRKKGIAVMNSQDAVAAPIDTTAHTRPQELP